MGGLLDEILRALWQSSRRVALAILAGLARWARIARWRDPAELEARILALPPRDQAVIVGAVLGGLFLVSLILAHWGAVGMLGFLLLVILLVN